MMLASGSIREAATGPVIVEAGTIRTAGNWDGDGQSTVVWGRWVQRIGGGCVYSFDPDPAAIAQAQMALDQGKIHHRTFTHGLEAADAFRAATPGRPLEVALVCAPAEDAERGIPDLGCSVINLLYLDAGDLVGGELDMAARLNREIFLTARESVEAAGTYGTVLIDDVNWKATETRGKGRYVFEEMAARGWHRYKMAPGYDYQGLATVGAPDIDPGAMWGVPLA